MAKERFSLAVMFPNSLDAALIPWLAGIPLRVGYTTDGRRWLLSHPIQGRSVRVGQHRAERYLGIVRALGADGAPLVRLPVSEGAQERGGQLLRDHGIGPADLIVAVNPGSADGSAKCWPPERFAAMADALVDR